MKKAIYGVLGMILVSCTDLEVKPTNVTTADIIFSDPNQYKSFLAKLYGGLSVTGQGNSSDLTGINSDLSGFLRSMFLLQEVSTDLGAFTPTGDQDDVVSLQEHSWTTTNATVQAFYARIFFNISQCNEFLRQSTADLLVDRDVPLNLAEEISSEFIPEARFLRVLYYYYGLDLFRNVPFFTEESSLGSIPLQSSPTVLFEFIESELKDLETILPLPRANEYGRADQGAVWFLLSRLYLNAEVYIGEARYDESIEYCNKILNANSYSLSNNYGFNFLADNETSPEIIFPIRFSPFTRSGGGISYLMAITVGSDIPPSTIGTSNGFANLRTTSALTQLFPDLTGESDSRSGLFVSEDRSPTITDFGDFRQGIAVLKYRNLNSDGSLASDPDNPETDFPLFRLAEVYLTYAESVLRGGNGDPNRALELVNDLRERAYGVGTGEITTNQLNLSFIVDERARELYFEGTRRTDLVRFDLFTENGIWPFKGGINIPEGRTTESFRNIYPIPSSDIIANPNLIQNPGY